LAWGVKHRARGENGGSFPHEPEGGWQDGASGLVLLAAARETGLIATFEEALPVVDARPLRSSAATRRMLLLTLLFLSAVELRRTWDLRGYAGDGLALLTGRRRAYGYRHVECFLSGTAHAGGADALTAALAAWTATLWRSRPRVVGPHAPSFYYVDGHRKAVYADGLIPRGLVARRGTVLGCRALVVLHDAAGHPLLATTHRGDLHLTVGLPLLLARYEQAAGAPSLASLVVDREGMAAAFLRDLATAGRTVVTVLRADQYDGLGSFTEVGAFVPLRHDRHGDVVREVASARYRLALPDRAGEGLELCVALVRDLRRRVPVSSPEDPRRWSDDVGWDGPRWWEDGWVATPAPAPATEAKLIPVVTTAREMDPITLADTYFHRWPCQENAIRDYLIPLGIDTNHGYAKTSVENSEVAKRRAAAEKRLANVQRWAERARVAHERASKRYNRLWKKAKGHGGELYRALDQRLWVLEEQGLAPHLLRRQTREQTAAVKDEMEQVWHRVHRALHTSSAEYAKHEKYCREQRLLLRQLADLAAGERTMHELDNRKDQVMTICKTALANLAMHVRDQYFPAEYRHATWQRLAPFFRLPGHVVWGPDVVHVDLRPFNDRQMTRDLVSFCERVCLAQPRLPSGQRLVFTVAGTACPILDVQREAVA